MKPQVTRRESMFAIVSVKNIVEKMQDVVMEHVANHNLMFAKEKMPDISVGLHCNYPYECSFKGHCWEDK